MFFFGSERNTMITLKLIFKENSAAQIQHVKIYDIRSFKGSRNDPLKLSINALSVSFPGLENPSSIFFS